MHIVCKINIEAKLEHKRDDNINYARKGDDNTARVSACDGEVAATFLV